MNATVLALRRACPGTLIGVSTGEWIERDEARTLASIDAWDELPDYASVNLGEHAAPAVMEKLRRRGIGIEAGLASVADAERLVKLDIGKRVLRILIEISEQNIGEALTVADGIVAVLDRAELRRPLLLHGFDATVWQFVTLAADRRWSTRVGLEDGSLLPGGAIASGNAVRRSEHARQGGSASSSFDLASRPDELMTPAHVLDAARLTLFRPLRAARRARAHTFRHPGLSDSSQCAVIGPMPQIAIVAGSLPSDFTPS